MGCQWPTRVSPMLLGYVAVEDGMFNRTGRNYPGGPHRTWVPVYVPSPDQSAKELETETGTVGIVHADCPRDSWQEFARGIGKADTLKAMGCEGQA